MKKKIKAILFDMDGVLIDAREWHYQALNRALSLFGIHINRLEHLTGFDGLPTKKKLELLSLEHKLPFQLHNFINKLKQKYTMQIILTHCRPYFPHQFALSRLRAQGFRLAVCSNSTESTVLTMMQKADLIQFLDLIVSQDSVTKPKPDPAMYLYAMKKFNLTGNQCLIIEDNPYGVAAARAAGGNCLKIRNIHELTFERVLNAIKVFEKNNNTRT